jgi:hypothetical protein
LCYAYLWSDEQRAGRVEGRKDRPCVVVLATEDADRDTIVTVVPMTHTPPAPSEQAVPVPQATKRRLGLDSEGSWLIVDEVNRFVWPGPDLRPISRRTPDRFAYGVLPPRLFRQVRDNVRACAARRRLRVVHRVPD